MTKTRPVRLAFVLPDLNAGGAERVALRLIRDFVGRGLDVDLVLLKREGLLLDQLPPEVRIFDLGVTRIRSAVLPLRRYLRQRRPDGIQIFMWPLTIVGILAHRLARSRSRLVVSDHTMLSKHNSQLGAGATRLMRASLHWLYPLADARVIVSNGAADDLVRLAKLPRTDIEVIYNPVSQPADVIAAEPAIEALWRGTGSRIISVGSLKAEKNHSLLIRSFAELVKRAPAQLMILGEGSERPRLEALAAELGVSDRLILPGFAPDPWPYYVAADLFVLSSDYEGYPLVLVEAMRAGLPIVSTDCESGPREILAGGDYGALVPVGDRDALAAAMVTALSGTKDPDRLQRRAEALSGQATSDRYLQLMLPARSD